MTKRAVTPGRGCAKLPPERQAAAAAPRAVRREHLLVRTTTPHRTPPRIDEPSPRKPGHPRARQSPKTQEERAIGYTPPKAAQVESYQRRAASSELPLPDGHDVRTAPTEGRGRTESRRQLLSHARRFGGARLAASEPVEEGAPERRTRSGRPGCQFPRRAVPDRGSATAQVLPAPRE